MVQLLKNLERACEGLAHGKGRQGQSSAHISLKEFTQTLPQ